MKAYEQEIAKDLISRHKKPEFLVMSKERLGERQVVIKPADNSPITFEQLKGREVVVCDDMVRTGGTIMACCKQLKAAGARRVLFVVTHFYSSQEVKENLGSDVIDEIVTTDTLPNILNRDMQGRLRKKILVLKLERWIVNELYRQVLNEPFQPYIPPYSVDISHKNPNWINNQALRDMEL